jgi:hypothetical protein
MQILLTKKTFFSSILMGAWLVLGLTVQAQTDTMPREPLRYEESVIIDDIEVDTAKRDRKHNPKIATISSAIIPGAGQVYNQKYWKVPIIWGGGLALYSYWDYNNTYYHRFKLANEQYDPNDPGAITDPELGDLDKSVLNQYKNYYRRHRDRAVIFMGLLYVANIIDAMVDAHMLDYDISKDLSLHWHPTVSPPAPYTYSQANMGVYVQLRF